MALYELLILGSPSKPQLAAVSARIREAAAGFDLTIPGDVSIRTAAHAGLRDPMAATAALYFGGDPEADKALVAELQAQKIPVIPALAAGHKIEKEIAKTLRSINGYFIPTGDVRLEGLAAALLECAGLLHQQRRVFVSYRRKESRQVAVQLHDLLSGRGFDVFLDTHDIRPGEPFQEMLWHRLTDSDVLIMLDTKDYFGSKWTAQEFGRSLAKGIHVLRVVWPGHTPSRHLSLGDTINLKKSSFTTTRRLTKATIEHVIERTEHLRSRSIATRHLEIAGKLQLEIVKIGGKFQGIGAHRSIALTLPSGKKLWAYPAVGVPTAELLNDVHSKAEKAGQDGLPFLVYDHIGIREPWLKHLEWLDTQISAVRALRVLDAAWELVGWDS